MDIAEGKLNTPAPTGNVKDFSGGNAPNLTFTKLLSAEIGGKVLGKSETTWNHMLIEVIKQAAAKLNDVNALKRLIIVNSVVGKRKEMATGTSLRPECRCKVRMLSAHGRRRRTSSRACTSPVRSCSVWHDNEKAVHPNQTGKLSVN